MKQNKKYWAQAFIECCYFYRSDNYEDILLLLSLAPEDELLETSALDALVSNNKATLSKMFDPYFVFKQTGQLRYLECKHIPSKIEDALCKGFQEYISKYVDTLLSNYENFV